MFYWGKEVGIKKLKFSLDMNPCNSKTGVTKVSSDGRDPKKLCTVSFCSPFLPIHPTSSYLPDVKYFVNLDFMKVIFHLPSPEEVFGNSFSFFVKAKFK